LKRIPDYPDAFAGWNAVASYGSYISVVASLLFFYIVYLTLTGQSVSVENPWTSEKQVQTLEWQLPSPPGFHTFDEIPSIKDPLMLSK